MQIASIYYFNYQGDVAYYDSYRNFCLKNMVYLGMAFSTPRVHVYASPTEYPISEERSKHIRSYVEETLSRLNVLPRERVKNTAEYFKVIYVDGSEKCYEYDADLVKLFKDAEEYRVPGESEVIMTPYLVFDNKDFGRIVTMVEEFRQLFASKKLTQIGDFLSEDCVLEEEYCGTQFISKKKILREIKKRCGFVNKNLFKVTMFSGLEGVLNAEGKSDIAIKVEVHKKGSKRINYLLQPTISENGKIKKITVRYFDDTIVSKSIFGEKLAKVKNGTYNDFENQE